MVAARRHHQRCLFPRRAASKPAATASGTHGRHRFRRACIRIGAFRQKHPHEIHVAHLRSQVQRRVSCPIAHVDIGTPFDERLRGGRVLVLHRHDQRLGAGKYGDVGIGAGLQERVDRRHIGLDCRKDERRERGF